MKHRERVYASSGQQLINECSDSYLDSCGKERLAELSTALETTIGTFPPAGNFAERQKLENLHLNIKKRLENLK